MSSIMALEVLSKQLSVKAFLGFSALLLAFLLSGVVSQAQAFEEAQVRIEVNSTDGDAGLQLFVDGGPWKSVVVRAPDRRIVYWVSNVGRLRSFGSSEFFMESNEPNFEEEMTLPEILEFLPEGEYRFSGRSIEKQRLSARATLTHDLPCGPVVTSPVADDPEEDPVLDPADPVMISWEEVVNKLDTDSDEGECGVGEVTVVGYEVVVENESTDPPELFSIKLPAEVLKVTLPPEFVIPDSEYKFEILAIEESGNQTITERTFVTSE